MLWTAIGAYFVLYIVWDILHDPSGNLPWQISRSLLTGARDEPHKSRTRVRDEPRKPMSRSAQVFLLVGIIAVLGLFFLGLL